MKFWTVLIAVVLVGVALPIALTSCVPGQVEETRAILTQIRADMAGVSVQVAMAKADLVKIEADIAAMPEGAEKEAAIKVAAKISEGIAASEKWLGKATQTASALDLALLNAEDGFGVAQAVLDTARDVAPPPWGYIVSSFGGLLLGLVRASYNRWTARNVVRSVDPLVTPDGPDAAAISAAQGAGGKRLVDEAQGRRLVLPF